MSDKPFFVGWGETPEIDRRFFLRAGVGLTTMAVAGAAGMAWVQRKPAQGSWDLSEVREYRGIVTANPYPMLRTRDLSGRVQTALLACETKCGVRGRLGALDNLPVVVRGTPIVRGEHAMIAVVEGLDWIAEDDSVDDAGLRFVAPDDITEVSLVGEILDTKCWFGAMNPAESKPHKACASLCIRGGIPPGFYVRDVREQSALLIMTQAGGAFGPELLPFVGEPVRIEGRARRFGDLLLLDSDPQKIRFTG